MQNLIQLLKDLEVPAIEPKVTILPRDRSKDYDLSYQLQLDLESHNKK